jgi:phage terminase Nu1 subunit (DNA packaging protein)
LARKNEGRRPQKRVPSATVRSRGALAKRLGRSERTIGEYLAKGMPGKPGSYDVAECEAWLAANLRPKPDDSDSSIARQIRQAELEERQENIRAKKLKNDLLEGRMYLVDDVELAAAELTNRIRERLERIPTEISQALPAKHRRTGRDRVAEIIHGILVEMAAWQPIEPKGE